MQSLVYVRGQTNETLCVSVIVTVEHISTNLFEDICIGVIVSEIIELSYEIDLMNIINFLIKLAGGSVSINVN